MLGRGDGSGRRPAARIVPILHAFLEEGIARLALQSLLIRTELAGRHFLLRIRATRHLDSVPLETPVIERGRSWEPQ